MSSLFWSPLAINTLLFTLLGGTFAVYFIARLLHARWRGRSASPFVLPALTFFGAATGAVLQTLSYVLDPTLGAWVLPWVGPAGATAMAALIAFSEDFGGDGLLTRRGRWLLRAGLTALVGLEVVIAIQRVSFLAIGQVHFRDAFVDIPFAVGFLAVTVFFFLHLRRALEPGPYRTLRTIWATLTPRKPIPGKPGAALARGFLIFSLTPILLAFVLVARSFGWFDWRVAEISVSWLVLLVFSSFAWVYLNHLPERSGTTTKITGLVLVTLLMMVSAMSWIVAPAIVDGFTDHGAPRSGQAFRLSPTADGGYDIQAIAAVRAVPESRRSGPETDPITLPFHVPFVGRNHSTLFVRDNGTVGMGAFPLLQDIRFDYGPEPTIFVLAANLVVPQTASADTGVFVDITPERVTITWAHMPVAQAPEQVHDAQLSFFADGTIELAHHVVPDRPRADLYRPDGVAMMVGFTPGSQYGTVRRGELYGAHLAAGEGLVDDRRYAFRDAMSRAFGPMAVFLVLATPIILFLFPVIIHLSISRPLAAIASGVERFRNGSLDTSIPVFAADEIGALAQAFNDVATERERMLRALESEVERRSAEAVELSASNARLHEREGLGRDLHDAVSQTLFASALMADTVPRLMGQDREKAGAAIGQVAELNRAALVEMRHLLMHLRPQHLLAVPFGELLRGIAADMERNFDLHVELSVHSDALLPEAVQIAFFRVAHAAITNTARHADVSTAHIDFDAVRGQAMLTVTDTGAGFDPNAVAAGHHGLAIMRERLQKIGGILEVEAALNKGCSIKAIWFADDSVYED